MLQKLTQTLTIAKRLGKTASTAGYSALKVAQGAPMDAYLLRQTFEKLGATYIKLGQFIASTPTIFPQEYVDAFADCLDNTAPVPFDSLRAVLDEAFLPMGGVAGVFAHIDPTPLASASIAQVHKAVLHTGETVVLKIQKPDALTVIHTDLSVLHGSFWLLEKVAPAFQFANLAAITDEIKSRMLLETDFVAERCHLERFLQFIEQENITHITAPKVYAHLSSQKVLTLQYLNGVSLLDPKATSAPNKQQLMQMILDVWFLSIMRMGEFHADLHAGNILLLEDGRVAFLDFGLVGQIAPSVLQACTQLVAATATSDYTSAAEAMMHIGITDPNTSQILLAQDLQRLFGQNPNAKNPHALVGDLVATGKKHGIRFPKDFALLTKQLLYFDRFMQTLAPDLSLFDDNRIQALS